MEKRVLVTGARAPVCLELARIFTTAGVMVDVADSSSLNMTRFSGKFRRFHKLPSPRFHYDAFKAEVLRLQKENSYDLIIPTCEEVFYFAKLKMEEKLDAIFCDDFSKVVDLHNKWRFVEMSQAWSIQAPPSHRLNSKADWKKLGLKSDDYVFKPSFSRFATHTFVSPEEKILDHLDDGNEWIAQKRIRGREICVYTVCVKGELRAISAYLPAYRAGLGAGIYLVPVNEKAILDFCTEFAKKNSFHGQASFDVMQDSSTGKFWLLECNPRATSGLHFFGRDLAECFIGERRDVLQILNAKPKMLAGAMLLYGAPKSFSPKAWGKFFGDFGAAKDVVWSLRDPWPAFGQYAVMIDLVARAAVKGISPLEVSTMDIEFNG